MAFWGHQNVQKRPTGSHNLGPKVSGHLRIGNFRPSKCWRLSTISLIRGSLEPFYVAKYRGVVDIKQGASNEGFNVMVKIAFSPRHNDEKMLNESPIFPNQEFHEPWRISFSVHEKTEKRMSMLDTYRSGCNATWVIALSGRQNEKVFTRNQEWHFQDIKMSYMAQR